MLRFSFLDNIKYRTFKLFMMLLNLFTIFLFSGRIRRSIRKYKESIYLTNLSNCNLNLWYPVYHPGFDKGVRTKYKTSSTSVYSLYYTRPETFIVSYRGEKVLLFSKDFKNDPRTKKILETLKEKPTK